MLVGACAAQAPFEAGRAAAGVLSAFLLVLLGLTAPCLMNVVMARRLACQPRSVLTPVALALVFPPMVSLRRLVAYFVAMLPAAAGSPFLQFPPMSHPKEDSGRARRRHMLDGGIMA